MSRAPVEQPLVDAPTQRLYLLAGAAVYNAVRLADAVAVQSDTSLLKWLALDAAALLLLTWLRVPRLELSPLRFVALAAAFILIDTALFSHAWSLLLPLLVPAAVKSFFAVRTSTQETTVRVAGVLGTHDSLARLGGQHTVHLLPFATAELRSTSCFCLPAIGSEPVLLPLHLNNTRVSRVTYSVTSSNDTTTSFTLSVHDLVQPASTLQEEEFDIDDWAVVPKVAPSATLRHSPPVHVEQSLSGSSWLIPIRQTGTVRLVAVRDEEDRPVRLKSSSRGIAVHACPAAGFSTAAPTHRCLGGNLAESLSLDLAVTGFAPLSVRWATTTTPQGARKGSRSSSSIAGIVRAGDADRIEVPVNVSLATAGRQSFVLESVEDGCGNVVNYGGMDDKARRTSTVPGMVAARDVVVHSPTKAVFQGVCARVEDVKLLEGKKASLEVKIDGEHDEKRFTARVKFTPAGEDAGTVTEVTLSPSYGRIEAEKAGTYELLGIKDRFCEGTILVPATCIVAYEPPPSVAVSFAPLLDACESEVGAIATVNLAGTPPYVLHYQIVQLSPVAKTQRLSKRIATSRTEIRFDSEPGVWEYRFVKLEDALYKDVALPREAQFSRRQTVNVVSGARWRNAVQTVRSCQGDRLAVEVELKGVAPWELTYSVVGQPPATIRDIQTKVHSIDLVIPAAIEQRGGQFTVSLETVKDANACLRRLTTATEMVVHVQRTQPTAQFHGVAGRRTSLVRTTDPARIPLRLTGEAPWVVRYQAPGSNKVLEATLQSHNAELVLSHPLEGEYTLLSVRDAYCRGVVEETQWTVEMLPRPTLRLVQGGEQLAKNGSYLRKAVCVGAVDTVSLSLSGKPPFRVSYDFLETPSSDKVDRVLSAIHPLTTVPLDTTSPGLHQYSFLTLSDALYPSTSTFGIDAPRSSKSGALVVQQMVHALPTGRWKHQSPKTGFCVGQTLASRGPDDLILELGGEGPFEIVLAVQEEGKASIEYQRTGVSGRYALDLPFQFTSPSTYKITLRSILDSNGCARKIEPTATISTTVQVHEIAVVTSVDAKEDYCIGESLDFILQGSAPFSLTYSFTPIDSKPELHTVTLQTASFSRLATKAGVFEILTVSHAGVSADCSKTINLRKVVHSLPSVRTRRGEMVLDEIREGEIASISWEFEGTKPFAFIYGRSLAFDRSKDHRLLESFFVSEIEEDTYSISTSEEGTWSAVYVKDRYCSYPPGPMPKLE